MTYAQCNQQINILFSKIFKSEQNGPHEKEFYFFNQASRCSKIFHVRSNSPFSSVRPRELQLTTTKYKIGKPVRLHNS